MPLRFECNQDPRKMKTVKGVKFCELCQKNVYDMRRKPVDKIVALKKEMGECCVILYEDQLTQAEHILNSETGTTVGIKKRGALPYAAGLAALSFLPHPGNAQVVSNKAVIENKKIVTEEGEKKKITSAGKDETVYNGLISSLPKRAMKKRKIDLGFYNEENIFVLVKTIKTRSDGSFSFSLTESEKSTFANEAPVFITPKYAVDNEACELDKPAEAIVINIRSKRRMVRGAF